MQYNHPIIYKTKKKHWVNKTNIHINNLIGWNRSGSTLEMDSGYTNQNIKLYPKSIDLFLRMSCVIDSSDIYMQNIYILCVPRICLRHLRFASPTMIIYCDQLHYKVTEHLCSPNSITRKSHETQKVYTSRIHKMCVEK